ncbi:MAG: ABC transporter substrate-binding protein [Anaerolineales bacterium]|nr:ABC transporter substrate-binding protein [Anaerolineales bacterium]
MRARRPLAPEGGVLLFVLAAAALSACLPVARPLIKLGLVAPFEGRYREVGYEVVYAVRLAVQEANAAGGAGGYSLALAALDDGGDPAQAREQAEKLTTDPDVLAVIGHWRADTTSAAAPIYAAAGLALLAPNPGAVDLPPETYRLGLPAATAQAALPPGAQVCPPPCDDLEELSWLTQARAADPDALLVGPPLWAQPQFAALAGPLGAGAGFVSPAPLPADSADPGFAERYGAIANGAQPRVDAVLAYDAARLTIASIAASAEDQFAPDRAGVQAALGVSALDGLSGTLGFDQAHAWVSAQAWLYTWQAGTPVLVRVAPGSQRVEAAASTR